MSLIRENYRTSNAKCAPSLRVLALSATPTADEKWAQRDTFEAGRQTLMRNLAVIPTVPAVFLCPPSKYRDVLQAYATDVPSAVWQWKPDHHELHLYEMLTKGPTAKSGATKTPLGCVGRLALCVLKNLGARAAAVYLSDCLQRVGNAKTPLTLGQVNYVKAARSEGKGTSSLVDQLLENLKADESSAKRILVLTQEKLATCLLEWVLRHQQHGLYTDFITGQSDTPHMRGMSRAIQQEKLKDFTEDGQTNILVATDVVEEGMDVSSCQLVVRTEPSQTVRKCIQAHGRVRKRKDGKYAVLALKEEQEKAEKNAGGKKRAFEWLFDNDFV